MTMITLVSSVFAAALPLVSQPQSPQPTGKPQVAPEGAEVVAGPEGRQTPFKTAKGYGDAQLHFEWLLRDERARKVSGQYRNLARVVFAGAGAIQLCDSYQADGRTVGVNEVPADSVAGAIVHQNPPAVNSIRGYGKWNSVDVIYHAGVWEGAKLVKAPEITVFQNGVLVQDHWAMEGEDRWIFRPSAPTKPKGGKAPISFERGLVQLRNVWVREI